jgi:hypothetical protein
MQLRFLRHNENFGRGYYASRCPATRLKEDETLLPEVEDGSGRAFE